MRFSPPKSLASCLAATLALAASIAIEVALPSPAAAQEARPVVYLTFDDGPGPDTPAFLDLLAAYNVQATFFVTGRAVANDPGTARRLVAEGHGIANHTWNHPALDRLSNAAIRSEFTSTSRVIENETGQVPTCYRPPYGATNARVHDQAVAVGLTNAQWTTGSTGSHFGLWDIDTNDWRLNLRSGWSEGSMRAALNRTAGGDTVLMHDGPSNRSRGLGVLRGWLADNHHRFDFQVLPGCSGSVLEPSIDDAAPQKWHRFQVARLYNAYFDRSPDAQGWEYWNQEYTNGASLAQISYWFAQSSEFSRSSVLSDADFVTFVYTQVLDRQPDPEGFAYWLNQLNGSIDRGELVLYFSESDEYIRRTAAAVTGGCYDGSVESSYRCRAQQLPTYDWSR